MIPGFRRTWSLTGEMLSRPGWDPRKDLTLSLVPFQSSNVLLSTILPQSRGRYVLEVSLVQEGVAWFHDLGMATAVADVPIEVR